MKLQSPDQPVIAESYDSLFTLGIRRACDRGASKMSGVVAISGVQRGDEDVQYEAEKCMPAF